MGSIKAKFEAFGWIVIEIEEGNNIDAVLNGMAEAKSKTRTRKTCLCFIKNNVMGNGSRFYDAYACLAW